MAQWFKILWVLGLLRCGDGGVTVDSQSISALEDFDQPGSVYNFAIKNGNVVEDVAYINGSTLVLQFASLPSSVTSVSLGETGHCTEREFLNKPDWLMPEQDPDNSAKKIITWQVPDDKMHTQFTVELVFRDLVTGTYTCKQGLDVVQDDTAPSGFTFAVAHQDGYTNDADLAVTFSMSESRGAAYVTTDSTCATGGRWQTYKETDLTFTLTKTGSQTVYARVRDNAGNLSECLSASVTYVGLVAGNSGVIRVTSKSSTSLGLSWTAATYMDTTTSLEYQVTYSSETTTNTTPWAAGITSATLTGLSPNSTYTVLVTVRDPHGLTAEYSNVAED